MKHDGHKLMGPTKKPVGIKEIARELGVSIGTVDRALHSRPGINPITRARVLKMAQTLGYRPNLAARYLKSSKQLRIAVDLPREIASYWDSLRQGITRAASPFEPAVHVDFFSSKRFLDGQEEQVFVRALDQATSGIIFAPSDPVRAKPWIRKAARMGIPVVCVATDAPGTDRLTSVSADPLTSGAMVGELMCRFLQGNGSFAVITGSLATEDHSKKVDGFRRSLKEFQSATKLVSVQEAHDVEQEAYCQTLEILRRHSELGGLYVTTANSLPVLQAIVDAGRAGAIKVITTDLFPALVPLIRSGQVLATIDQRPLTQGRLAFQSLYQFLVEGRCPPSEIRLAPHIIMRSNLELSLTRQAFEYEGETPGLPDAPIWTGLEKLGANVV